MRDRRAVLDVERHGDPGAGTDPDVGQPSADRDPLRPTLRSERGDQREGADADRDDLQAGRAEEPGREPHRDARHEDGDAASREHQWPEHQGFSATGTSTSAMISRNEHLGGAPAHDRVRRDDDAVRQGDRGERLHVVGDHVVPLLGGGERARGAQDHDRGPRTRARDRRRSAAGSPPPDRRCTGGSRARRGPPRLLDHLADAARVAHRADVVERGARPRGSPGSRPRPRQSG